MLVFGSFAATLAAKDPQVPTPPLHAGQKEGGVSAISIPIRPTGKYSFVNGFIPTVDQERIRELLPYEWIEIEWMVPGQLFKNIPPVDHRLRLNLDGSTQYVTGSFGDDVCRTGKISFSDFGRYCLLLEQFGVGTKECDLGRTVAVSHPLESTLRVHSKSGLHTYQNADKIGDYRFWLIQTALMQQVSDVAWITEPAQKNTEQNHAPKSAIDRP